ncbi:aldehyde-activating protein [Amylibacter kogurei]|uniref:Aldehyde-activating protein n=1 Tax=Paramylibacter kogurei TaxID=1889778 RepID=A0A2G5K191_9RHOB|nr:GFA family protein [Amylibacter kogurei]PIB22879.1 aldehyde-activating protein [Amylibacter kogurei]
MQTGSCECGSVTFEITGNLRPVVACHCTQCRKTSGHYWAATQVDNENLKIINKSGLKWFRSSNFARRGFCTGCGASLFWQLDGENATSIGAGALDGETNLKTEKHICCADKGDYYDISDGLPQVAGVGNSND